MKPTLTRVCQLQPTPEQATKIEATLKAFASACNYTNSVVKPTVTNKVRIQGTVYDQIGAKFKLSANLALILEYKGIQAGVEIVVVNPRYTSQTGHQCLHIGLRTAKNFKCGSGGWHGDADLNGSLMIQILGAAVSQPERSVLSGSIQAARTRAKVPVLQSGVGLHALLFL